MVVCILTISTPNTDAYLCLSTGKHTVYAEVHNPSSTHLQNLLQNLYSGPVINSLGPLELPCGRRVALPSLSWTRCLVSAAVHHQFNDRSLVSKCSIFTYGQLLLLSAGRSRGRAASVICRSSSCLLLLLLLLLVVPWSVSKVQTS